MGASRYFIDMAQDEHDYQNKNRMSVNPEELDIDSTYVTIEKMDELLIYSLEKGWMIIWIKKVLSSTIN